MIYVVERDGRPVRSRQHAGVLAYDTHDSATRAAKTVGGKVTIYGVGGAVHGEQLAREAAADAERWRAERDAAVAELEVLTSTIAEHSEPEDASAHDTLARLARKAKALSKIAKLLANIYLAGEL